MTWYGYRARWQGVEYAANPDPRPDGLWMRLRSPVPAEGFEEVEPGCFVRPVRADACEEAVFVTTVCVWRGEPFQVVGGIDDELLLEYIGGRVTVARRLELERVERGVHRCRVSLAEVVDLHEHVESLLC
ncbi:hypothetical protein [Nonomuraea cavernae]|uniref:Uncharacterized protein n=1 Tax=Nonomuraea cavernae TaxID=2045107 RepID=A0A917Z7S3_9ACTN|nr:hypothetical protein [Nonomuraea cavernae]MCA2189657.1 hypothetical protein [Nonomuraea cavernae]GGO77445.1 hypothetical protein GCM10012289_57140 [Nonomuraea cavernae]